MVYELQVRFEAIDSGNAPSFVDNEWSVILTQAQYDVALDLIKMGIESNEFVKTAISPLISKSDVTSFSAALDSDFYYYNGQGFYATGPSDLWVILGGRAVQAGTSTRCVPIDHEFFLKNMENPFKKPSAGEEFWITRDGSNIYVITDSSNSVTNLYLEYIRDISGDTIVPGTTDCVLHESVHRMVVNKAAELANLYVNDPQSFQAHKLENRQPEISMPFM